jgi:hypothetical protein
MKRNETIYAIVILLEQCSGEQLARERRENHFP